MFGVEGFGSWTFGSRVLGLGFGVWHLVIRAEGSGLRVEGFGFTV